MKTCNGCERTLGLDQFHRSRSRPDGRQSRCKDCQREHLSTWRRANPDKARAQSKRRPPERTLAAVTRWRQRYPERRRAHSAVLTALRSGALVRPDACEACSSTSRLHAHHHDYSQPLDVRWLCPPCHAKEHTP